MIKEKEGIPQHTCLRLIFGGKCLDYKYTLADYKIPRDSTLHVVERLWGGGGTWIFTNMKDFQKTDLE